MEGKGNKSSDYYLNVRRQSIALVRYLVVAWWNNYKDYFILSVFGLRVTRFSFNLSIININKI